ncbi:neoverrucotoxin subunit beta-like protein [Colletotrichum kahawae]|uniref:Neoverrucotoxin subunit beta-like protein n=1 Tax=Colletotrichum kahawae TaxID=34407 RepID=A0AAD9Y737_COLKA|nr:neoverrucotoxin subunit beta-like protein [Colletotrichum kahawae]
MGFSNDISLSQPALGQDIQLGMLYDVRTSRFYGGVSLWDNSVVNAKQELDEAQVQNADFVLSDSLEQARESVYLDTEGSLNLDLKLCSAIGSAKFLNDRKSTTHEARLDASCTVVRRTRRIPQEVLASMKYDQYLDDARYNHFVAEVVEGGSATLSFVRACSSADEARKIAGELKVSVVNVPVNGGDKVEFSAKNESLFDDVKISYSGAIAENVSSLEDARRVAGEMPKTLGKQMNALSCTLLPLSILDRKASRIIRSLDSGLVTKTAAALKDGNTAGLMLQDLISRDEFEQEARRLLPELRDGTKDENTNATALRNAVKLFQQRTGIAKRFIDKKSNEANVLETTLASLSAEKFENHLGALKVQSLTGGAAPRLFLSLGGLSIGIEKHPLQASIESGTECHGLEPGRDLRLCRSSYRDPAPPDPLFYRGTPPSPTTCLRS